MWNFIKTSVSVLGLFIILVLLAGLYSSLVQEKPEKMPDNDNDYKTLPGDNDSSEESATSSDFIDFDPDESNLEDIPTF